MSNLKRFGVSLDEDLLQAFDERLGSEAYETRSKAISDLIKNYIDQDIISKATGSLSGAILFMYDHHIRDLVSKLLSIQHESHDIIISMQHIHLDHNTCLEILAVKGNADEVRNLYNKIKALKAVKKASISVSSVSENDHK